MQARTYHIQALTALHIGTGQGVGVVDLPIARAKATNLPQIPGSAIKGVLRDEAAAQYNLNHSDIRTLFGPDSGDADSHAGALAFGDAHLLLLPVRSFAGTVAYATCPFILHRYARDLGLDLAIPNAREETAYLPQSSLLHVEGDKVALEDLDLNGVEDNTTTAWAQHLSQALYPDGTPQATEWRQSLTQRLIVLPDDIYSYLADTATEIRTRIRINRDTRIVQDGALWTEENLPAETVLWGIIGISDARNRDSNHKKAAELSVLLPEGEITLQLGGKHTVGRGFCRLLLAHPGTGENA